ncbi:MAG: zinc-ribbon domain-containing protein [Deltaproteobacteria bacterium]|nr:zinc-ribbon domain-containing protein [Deltaproteobacteria bacterium]
MSMPGCAFCGGKSTRRHDGRSVCSSCYHRELAPKQACWTCGRVAPVTSYQPGGEPVCNSCYKRHPTRNGSLTPDGVLAGSGKKVWWLCREGKGHVWLSQVRHRTREGTGCPFCVAQAAGKPGALPRVVRERRGASVVRRAPHIGNETR